MPLYCDPEFCALLVSSYRRTVGAPPVFLRPGLELSAQWLYEEAPCCVLAHDTQSDPYFIYANRAAQNCFGYSWQEFLTLPSRLSAETADRSARQRLLDAVASHGFATGYSGVRITKSGQRFSIQDGVVWQLIDSAGSVRGQAAAFFRFG
jgi:PAS domain-containing protein